MHRISLGKTHAAGGTGGTEELQEERTYFVASLCMQPQEEKKRERNMLNTDLFKNYEVFLARSESK